MRISPGDAGVFKGNVTSLTYDPGKLVENTTYYWRIDERDAVGEVHPGEIWSFTTVGPGIGVKAEYFKGTELAGTPVKVSLLLIQDLQAEVQVCIFPFLRLLYLMQEQQDLMLQRQT